MRIRDADGQTVGVGFLVGDRDVLTCAHVVTAALRPRADEDAARVLGARLQVQFLISPGPGPQAATVEMFDPPRPDETGDVALLRLVDAPPADARAARLASASDLWGHTAAVFGFPTHPTERDMGVWAEARLRARQAAGWVQMDGFDGYRVGQGFSGSPVWDRQLNGVAGMLVAAETNPSVRAAYCIPTSLLLDAYPDLRDRVLPACPYRGLASFRRQDADVFFGREELAERLIELVVRRPLTLVVGSSGSGKSSLVSAGVIPRLEQQGGWAVAEFRPSQGKTPWAALAAALLPLLDPPTPGAATQRLAELDQLEAALADGRLIEVAGQVRAHTGTRRLLLVVDQFEELNAQHPQPSVVGEFVDALVAACSSSQHDSEHDLGVLLTLRDGFVGQALAHPGLASLASSASLLVGSMTREQFGRAIEGPLEGLPITFEPGLVDVILDDLGDMPGSLPLLEFTLTLLWEQRHDQQLTLATYQRIGRVRGALAQHAEALFSDSSSAPDAEAARRLLLQLVTPQEDAAPTRRIAYREDLDDAQWAAAQRLATHRLVVLGRDPTGAERVELAHEALITAWRRLADWVASDRGFRSWQERLRSRVSEWERNQRAPDGLLRGAALQEAEKWSAKRAADLSERERGFIRASQRHRARRTFTVGAIVAGVLVAALTVGILSVVAEGRRRHADAQTHLVASSALARQVTGLLDAEPDVAALLSVAAVRVAPTEAAHTALFEAADRLRSTRGLLAGHSDSVTGLAVSPDGRLVASGGADHVVLLWDPRSRAPIGDLLRGHDGPVDALAFDPRGRLATGSSAEPEVHIWDTTSQPTAPAMTLNGHHGGVIDLQFSHDRSELAVATGDQRVRVWKLTGGTATLSQERMLPGLHALGYDAHGVLLAATVSPEQVSVWDVASGRRKATFLVDSDPTADPTPVEFVPGSRRLLVSSTFAGNLLWDPDREEPTGVQFGEEVVDEIVCAQDGARCVGFLSGGDEMWIASTADGDQLASWPAPSGQLGAAAFLPNGELVAGAGQMVVLADTEQASRQPRQPGGTAAVATNHANSTIAMVGIDGRADLWAGAGRPIQALAPASEADFWLDVDGAQPPVLAYSADGSTLAGLGFTQPRQLWLWGVPSRRRIATPDALAAASIRTIALDQSGTLLAAAREDDQDVYIWDLEDPDAPPRRLPAHQAPVTAVAFHPTAPLLATGDASGMLHLWNLTGTSAPTGVPLGQGEAILSLAFDRSGTLVVVDTNELLLLRAPTYQPDREDRTPHGFAAVGPDPDLQVTVSPDGTMIAVTEVFGVARLWRGSDLVSLGELFSDHSVAFAADSKSMMWVDAEEVVTQSTDPDDWAAHLCSVVGRELTEQEWQRHAPAGIARPAGCD